MNLKNYLENLGIKLNFFAEKAKISPRTLYNAIHGGKISTTSALKIEEATDGKVTAKNLLKDKIKYYKKKKIKISKH